MLGTIPPDRFLYQFPCFKAKPLKGVDIHHQLEKVDVELLEVWDEVPACDPERLATELMDVIHACETALRMIETWENFNSDMDKVKEAVIRKNLERGYYGQPPETRCFAVKMVEDGQKLPDVHQLCELLKREGYTSLEVAPIVSEQFNGLAGKK